MSGPDNKRCILLRQFSGFQVYFIFRADEIVQAFTIVGYAEVAHCF